MKKNLNFIGVLCVAITLFFASCQKDNLPTPTDTNKPVPTNNYMTGLGTTPGFPSGRPFVLPSNVSILGDIRGGQMYKSTEIDKDKYTGPFPINMIPKSWVAYGTGTYVNLYIKFFNSLPTPTSLVIPGGLIFVDSLDSDTSNGMYQKGFILQDVTVPLPAMDTAFVILQAYCLNHTLYPSSYNAVYFIGPITNNPNLDSIVTIMAPKMPPIGQEYSIQSIIWNVTDYGLNLTAQEVQYLNSLP